MNRENTIQKKTQSSHSKQTVVVVLVLVYLSWALGGPPRICLCVPLPLHIVRAVGLVYTCT